MATQFRYTCPHCNSAGAGFSIVYQWPERNQQNRVYLLAICGICNRGITVLSEVKRGAPHINLIQNSVAYPSHEYSIIRAWPDTTMDIPDAIPENIGRYYRQGMENLSSERWDAAGAMFRKALDVSTKIIAPELSGFSLYNRINKLVEQGQLTSAMGEWSHEIRLDGNDAVHDEEPETQDDAVITQKFTEAFLTYCFSLPAMVANNREKRVKSPS